MWLVSGPAARDASELPRTIRYEAIGNREKAWIGRCPASLILCKARSPDRGGRAIGHLPKTDRAASGGRPGVLEPDRILVNAGYRISSFRRRRNLDTVQAEYSAVRTDEISTPLGPAEVVARTEPSKTRNSKVTRNGWWVPVALGALMLAVSVIGTVSAASRNLHDGPKLAAPGSVSVHLEPGSYAIYEDVEDAAFPLDAASISIVGPDGEVPSSTTRSTFSALGSPLAKTSYSSAVGFTARSPGIYRLSVRASDVALVIGKSPASVVHEALGWIACGVVGIVIVIAAVVLMFVRRNRNRRSITSRPGKGHRHKCPPDQDRRPISASVRTGPGLQHAAPPRCGFGRPGGGVAAVKAAQSSVS